ncbi:MAG: hypothetical protein CL535_13095 [Ahrensia sp.]|nr:hypothetical protein [Ahrensia sp.]|tara:strand:+ start:614 stop:1930 length:1317 start_codon:yes stop_codon:yes gene_type:complete
MRFYHAGFAIAVAAAVQVAGSAHAADEVAMQPGAETPFGGFYVGAEVAHSLANNKLEVGQGGDTLTFDGWGGNGFSGGVFAGYDHVFNNGYLIGGQIGGSISDIGSHGNFSSGGGEYFRGELKTDWFAQASVRAGYLTNPETLLFGSLGVTVAHGVGSYDYFDGTDGDSDSDQEFFYGVALGTVGIETVLSGNVRGRFEYVASYLNQQNFTFDEGVSLGVTPIIGSAKVSLVYGFGGSQPVDRVFANAPETWSGFFGGVRAGHEMGTTKLTVDDGSNHYEFDGFGSNGLMAGAFLGYNHQIGSRFVVGVEGHVSATTINNRLALEGEGSIETGTGSSLSGRIRAGVLVNPATLLYAYGGYGRNWMYTEISDGFNSQREHFHVDAVEFGGGAETFVTERVSVRGEYGIVLTENLLDDLGAPASLKKTGATGSISAVLHF